MKVGILGIVFLLNISVWSLSAQNDSLDNSDLPVDYIPYRKGLMSELSYTKDEIQADCYKKEVPYYYSSSLYLYPDSSFLYYYYSPTSYYMSFGHYSRVVNKIILNWDSLKTENITTDPEFYEKHFKYGKPK